MVTFDNSCEQGLTASKHNTLWDACYGRVLVKIVYLILMVTSVWTYGTSKLYNSIKQCSSTHQYIFRAWCKHETCLSSNHLSNHPLLSPLYTAERLRKDFNHNASSTAEGSRQIEISRLDLPVISHTQKNFLVDKNKLYERLRIYWIRTN